MNPTDLETLLKHWNFLPFENEALDEKKLMDHVDLEVGSLEILRRGLPPYTLVVPVQLPPMLLHSPDRGAQAETQFSLGLLSWWNTFASSSGSFVALWP